MSDAPRPDGDDAPRREAPPAIGITRMCLKSGGVQVPRVLAGRLPEGEVAAYDADADAPLTLYAEPPRRLEGLEAYFERHGVEVNDELLVDLDGDVLTLSLRKRPRRDVPDVTPSTWTSLREPAPTPPTPDPGPPAGTPAEAQGDAFASLDAGDPDAAMLTGEAPEPRGGEDDVPRAPRVRSHPEGRDAPPPAENDPFAWTEDVDDGPVGSLWRRVRGLLGGAATPDAPSTPTWTPPLREPPDPPAAPTGAPEPPHAEPPHAEPTTPARPDPAYVEPAYVEPAQSTPTGGDAGAPPAAPARPPRSGAHVTPGPPPDPADAPAPVGPASVAPPSTPLFPADAPTPSAPDPAPDPGPDTRQDPAQDPAQDAAPAAGDAPASDDAAPGDGATLPAGVPIRTRDEGDAGGDLRSRLEAYLTHPEMPLVAKSDVIAKRFGLEVATADDLLHDIAAAPPDGVRLTRVRDGAWRVERRLG